MHYVFTAVEQTQIRTAIDACAGLVWNPREQRYAAREEAGTTLYETLSAPIGSFSVTIRGPAWASERPAMTPA